MEEKIKELEAQVEAQKAISQNLTNLLNGLTTTAYQMSDGVASLLNEDGEVKEDALAVLLDKDRQRVEALKVDTKSIFDDAHKKATKEVLSKFENDLKQYFSLASENKGIDLVKEIVANHSKPADGVDVSKSLEYIEMVERKDKEKDDAVQEVLNKWDAYKMEIEEEKTYSKVAESALSILDGLNPILSSDAKKASNQKSIFVDLVKRAGKYRVAEQGVDILDAEGNILQNEHGHRVKFDEHVRQIASNYFDFYESKAKEQPTIPAVSTSTFSISSEEDFRVKVQNAKTPEERKSLHEAYQKFKSK